MIELIPYLMSFVLGFTITLIILMAIKIENYFQKNKVFEIRLAYIFFSILGGYLFSELITKIISFIIK